MDNAELDLLVIVTWFDSAGCAAEWSEIGDDSSDRCSVCRCHSVGWIKHIDAHCLLIVPHLATIPGADGTQGMGDLTIPRGAIQRIDRVTQGSCKETTINDA